MPTLASLKMISLESLQWPVTYRFLTSGPGGFSSTEFTLDMWRMIDRPDDTKAVAPLIWARSVAYATSHAVRLELCEVMMWKLPTGPQIVGAGDHVGHNMLTAGARDRSLILVSHDAVMDRFSSRRTAIHGFPRDWSTEGMLNEAGWTEGMRFGHVIAESFSHDTIGGGFQQLHHWTRVVPFDITNLFGVAFRRVNHWSICQHVGKAPDYELGLWPEHPLPEPLASF